MLSAFIPYFLCGYVYLPIINNHRGLTMLSIKRLVTLSFLLPVGILSTPVLAQQPSTLKQECVAMDAELRQGQEGTAEYVEYIPVCYIEYTNGEEVISRDDGEDYLKPPYLSKEECLRRMRDSKSTWCE